MDVMQKAINEAKAGVDAGDGGPFGAAIVRGDEIISLGHNTVLKDKDPTCHAEVNAIRKACAKLKTHHLDGLHIYTTAEPCPMCLSAIYWARLSKIYIGVDQECAARYGFDDANFYQQLNLPASKRDVAQETGVLSSECEMLFKYWYDKEGRLY